MALAANTRSSREAGSLKQALGHFWQRITEPDKTVNPNDRRTARLLTGILVGLNLNTIIFLVIVPLLENRWSLNFFADELLVLMMLVSYYLSRTRHFRLGVSLLIAISTYGFVTASVPPTYTGSEDGYIFFTAAHLIVAAIAYSRPFVLALAIGQGLLLAGLQIVYPNLDLTTAFAFNAAIGILMVLFSMHRDGLERDRQQALSEAFEREREAAESAQREREERIRVEESDRMKSAFLASMSHELRTPLNAIINYTKFVANGTLGAINDEQKEVLDASAESAEHLLNLINDVLDMSKIESGSLTLFVEEHVQLGRILDVVVSTGRSLLAGKPVTIELRDEAGLSSIRGDRQRILQILLNIMSNACKFTDTGSITVTTQRSDSEIVIAITDTGPGIAPEEQPQVFEAFKQTSTGLRKGGGTGLGMPISKRLAEAHGGRMWLESVVGKGTTFFVALPTVSSEVELLTEAALV